MTLTLPQAEVVMRKQPGVLRVETGPDATKEPLAQLEKTEGFEGLYFQGTVLEDPGRSLRVTKWRSVEASQTALSLSPSNASVEHFQMYDPIPETNPECYEFVSVQLKPEISFPDFYREWAPGLQLVVAFDGCPYAALGQGIENPQSTIQIQPWRFLDDHLVGFKQSPKAVDVMAQLKPMMTKFREHGRGIHVMVSGV